MASSKGRKISHITKYADCVQTPSGIMMTGDLHKIIERMMYMKKKKAAKNGQRQG